MLKKFSVYLKGYERYAVLAPALVVIEVICQLYLPKIMAAIVDVGIPRGDTGYIFRMGGLMILLAVACMVCGVLGAKYASICGQGFGANLRQGLFGHIQDFSFGDIDRFSSASLITRLTNDTNNIQLTLTMGMRVLTRSPVMLVASLLMAVSINGRLALVLAVVVPVLVLAVFLLMRVSIVLFRRLQEKIDALNNTVQENLVAIRVVKAFVRREHEQEKFSASNDNLMHAAIRVAMRVVLMLPIMMICFNTATVLALWSGGLQIMGGTLTVGELSAFLTYITQILISVMMLAMSLLQVTRAQASARRISEVLDTRPSITDGPADPAALPAPRGSVEFRDVSFKYLASGTGDDVLTHVNLSVEPGRFVAIVGGTGTGKSSLVNLIPRFYDVTGGAVLVDGMDVRDYPLEALRGRIGMVLQTSVLFSGTIRKNLLWGNPDATEADMIRAARDAQAYDFIHALPEGFDTQLSQGGVNLSGGQKQRLCIARAMLKKPAVLILDDATSAVDTATEKKIRRSFRENLQDTTILVIAQRISSVRYADQIVVLDEGTVAACGTHEELLEHCEIYQEICASQKEGVME